MSSHPPAAGFSPAGAAAALGIALFGVDDLQKFRKLVVDRVAVSAQYSPGIVSVCGFSLTNFKNLGPRLSGQRSKSFC